MRISKIAAYISVSLLGCKIFLAAAASCRRSARIIDPVSPLCQKNSIVLNWSHG
jgi:hypothetical protein